MHAHTLKDNTENKNENYIAPGFSKLIQWHKINILYDFIDFKVKK